MARDGLRMTVRGAVRGAPARFAAAVLLTGCAAGAGGAGLVALLHAVQHLAFGSGGGTCFADVIHAPPARRLSALAAGGLLTGTGWWALRRRHPDMPRPAPSPLADLADAVLQVTAVGVGGSLGREGAARTVGRVAATWLAARLQLAPQRGRVLAAAAAGAGAGLAAVYNVPIAGALAQLRPGSCRPRTRQPARCRRRPALSLAAALASPSLAGDEANAHMDDDGRSVVGPATRTRR